MPLLRQLEFAFERSTIHPLAGLANPGGAVRGCGYNGDTTFGVVRQAIRLPQSNMATAAVALQFRGRDVVLEAQARELLQRLNAEKLAREVRVEWNSRLQTAAGRADYGKKSIALNPRIREHGEAEIDRTLRHELAHLLAQVRAGRRRIEPHGPEWRQACSDLGIADEARCHKLPLTTRTFPVRFVYRCPNCRRDFPRVRRIRRAVACLACCRAHNRGEFDARFKLVLVDRDHRARC